MPSMTGASGLNTGLLAKLGAGPRVGQDLARTSAALGRGANQGKKLNAAPWSGTWPAPSATLDLDFANDRGFVRGVGQGRSMDAVTFTRASVGRFVDQDGLLQEAANNEPRFDWASTAQVAQNLIGYSEEFNQWSASAVTITVDQIAAPNGTTTADLITESSAGSHRVGRSYAAVAGTSYTLSCYFKNNNRQFAAISSINFNTANSTFDLVNGTSASNTGHATSMQDVGDGWWRCSVSFVATTTTTSSFFVGMNNSNSGAGPQEYASSGLSLYIWGAQIDAASSATEYKQTGLFIPTNTPLAANPTSNGLLIEEARTNRLLWNRDATDAAWVKTDVTAAKDQTGIDGVANAASSLTSTADNGTCIQTITLASGSRTGSVFLKRITGTGNVQVSLDGSTWSTVDLSDTEWRRIVLSGTVTNPTVGIRIAVSGDAVAMDYGQVEDGAFATSPILTTTASVTRSADTASISGQRFRDFYDQNGGTVYCDCSANFNPAGSDRSPFSIIGNVVLLGFHVTPGGGLLCEFTVPGFGIRLSLGAVNFYSPNNFSVSFSQNGFGYGWLNNQSPSALNFRGPFGIANQLAIGSGWNGTLGAGSWTGCIKQIVYSPQIVSFDATKVLTERNK
jgi:hypothetical protein